MKTSVTLRPLGDHVVVLPLDAEDKSPGGIVIPEIAKDKPTRGRVVAVGSGSLMRDGTRAGMEIGEGDIVLFARYGGTSIDVDDMEYIVLRESDVLAVLGNGR